MSDSLHTRDALPDHILPGDERVFSVFYKEYAERFFYFCTRFINNDDEAKTIVDEKFATMWELRAGFHTVSDMRAYMYTSLRNACYQYLREEGREFSSMAGPEVEESVDHRIVRTELMKALYDRIQQLSPQKKEVMELLYFQDLTIAQTAERMGISEDSVRQNKSRALKELRSKAIADKLLFVFLLLLR